MIDEDNIDWDKDAEMLHEKLGLSEETIKDVKDFTSNVSSGENNPVDIVKEIVTDDNLGDGEKVFLLLTFDAGTIMPEEIALAMHIDSLKNTIMSEDGGHMMAKLKASLIGLVEGLPPEVKIGSLEGAKHTIMNEKMEGMKEKAQELIEKLADNKMYR